MGLGLSIFLAAIGAVLTFGVNAEVAGLNIDVIGVVLMVVGFVGGIVSYTRSRGRDVRENGVQREVHHDRPAEREVIRER